MATDAAWTCPVCSEALSEPADQCFRCETPLAAWWPFEDAARAVEETREENLVLRQMALPRKRSMASAVLAFGLGSAIAFAAVRWIGLGSQAAIAPTTPPVSAPALTMPAQAAPEPRPPTKTVPGPRTVVFDPDATTRITYRVQRGDSLWRIAAALTGDGSQWRALFPSHDPSRPLQPGATISISLQPDGR